MILDQSQYSDRLRYFIDAIDQNAFHNYANRFVNYPPIDIFQLHFNLLMLKEEQCSEELQEVYSVCLILLQLALDMHEQIEIQDPQHKQKIRQRQLTILSGDLFSGYYYYYLSQKNHIDFIHVFATAIRDINEFKTKLHSGQGSMDESEQLKWYVKAKSELIRTVIRLEGVSLHWLELYERFTEIRFHRQHVGDQAIHLLDLWSKQLDNYSQPIQDELRLWLDEISEVRQTT